MPGWFPTSKAPQQKIRYRSPLMADGLMHIDTDPQVRRISPYPLSLVFGVMDESGELKKREQTPDLAVLKKDGSVVFIDFVPYQIQQANSWYEDRELNLREFCRDVYGSAYPRAATFRQYQDALGPPGSCAIERTSRKASGVAPLRSDAGDAWQVVARGETRPAASGIR